MREDRWLRFKGNGLETGPPWPSRGSVEGGFPEGGCQLPWALSSALLAHTLFMVLCHSRFSACSTNTKEALTEFTEEETGGKNRQDQRRSMVQGTQPPPYTTVSHSLVPPTTLSVHALVKSKKHAVREAKRLRGGGLQGPSLYQ